ncbi:hypothetical protein Mapa_017583 [Marchantia paleacea]|nr:hypothetical protein Mapa_017583 [Marchantia paleacea]
MVRLLGLNSRVGIDTDDGPREVVKTPNTSGDSGWLIRFFDSSFFCEWIAISYLYKHEHSGVRDYLCNRMYALPIAGIETYLFQLCYMLLHMPSPSLDKYIVDMCSKSLRIAIKVHWFLLAELEDVDDSVTIQKLQERCQTAALNGDWPPLIKPHKNTSSPAGGKIRMFNKLLSSRRLLSTSSPPHQKQSSSYTSPAPLDDGVREGNKSSSDDTDSTLKVFKKLLPGPKVREAFLKKFREKEEEDGDRPKDAESENFFRRLFRDKEDEERAGRSEDFANPDGFFRRLFRDKHESDDRIGGRSIDDDEKEGFFRKLFRDKHDDRDRGDAREKGEDDEKISMNWEDEEVHEFHEFSLFKRFFRVHPEDESLGLDGITGTPDGSPGESFFKRLFKDREDGKFFSLRREDGTGMSPSNFLKRLFKDRGDEDATMPVAEDGMLVVNTHINTDLDVIDQPRENVKAGQVQVKNGYNHSESPVKEVGSVKHIENCTDTSEDMEFADALLGDRKLFFDAEDAIHRDEPIAADKVSPDPGFCKLVAPPETPPPVTKSVSFTLAGSPLRKPERTSSKPPLPRHSTFRIRKGTYHATLDFVQSLCDTSTGLADVFPMEDRRKSLQESLQELNDHLVSAENDGGVCFPMGRGLCRVVHIPEDEAVLLNSREKAPFLICVEVLRCDSQRPEANREGKEIIPRRRGGIPLANSDVQFPRPPSWAFPTWNHPMQHPNTEQLLRTASKAIDQALAQLLDSKLKVVDVTLSVKKRVGPRSDSGNLRISDNEDALVCTSTGSRGEDELRSEAGNSTDGEQVALERSREETLNGGSVEDNKREDCAGQSGDRGAEGSLASVSESVEAAGLLSDGSSEEEWVTVVLTSVAGLNMEDVEEEHPVRKKEHRRVPSTIAMAEVTAAAAKGEAPAGLPVNKAGSIPSETQIADKRGMDAKATDALAGELWEHKKERIRKTSKFGSLADWDLCSMIVKSGDDCRQEHLAVQLVAQFYDIFQEAGLPLWLRPYEVLVTSSHTALIETIPDTASIHAIKSRNSNLVNLREFFCNKYIEKTPEFTLAQRNFVESMAGYSILCYMLQVKDRHNGNLLLDEEGHIIHIDFGFMLSNSPGGVNFESAPFKLTRELLEVMDSDAEGKPSEFFDYFKVLCIQGFLLCRKHAERIILLVEMMQDSGCPCFKGGPRTIQNLRKRFHLNLTEQQCVSLVLSLIDNSLDAWRTRQYDYYQRVLNGIL